MACEAIIPEKNLPKFWRSQEKILSLFPTLNIRPSISNIQYIKKKKIHKSGPKAIARLTKYPES